MSVFKVLRFLLLIPIRALLNFGHTVGHALELKYGFDKIKHGEAVAYGMISASYISFKLKKENIKYITTRQRI